MMIEHKTVTAEHARPLGKPGECFYCKQPMGRPHGAECVIPTRRVRIRAVIEYERDVPANSGTSLILFGLNEGSSCADNELERMSEYGGKHGCLCDFATFEYLGECGD